MAVDMFIKFTPELKGESKDKTYPGAIDVLAWSWGVSNSGTAHMGGGAGAGKANFQDLSFTKYVDLSSAELIYDCASGKHLDEAKLIVRKAGEKPLEYIIITLTEVLVTAVSTGGSAGEDRLTENVTLNFAKFQIDYKEQSPKGVEGGKGKVVWDIAANAKD
jgi:type VI secretion system secreted protein Hcp